jgi:hypothetical protein
VLSLRTQEQSCIALSVLIANRAGLSKHINYSLVGRAGVIIEVAILANRLLK